MSTFTRSGHWRTNAYGTTYWVSDHTVTRYDWDRLGDVDTDHKYNSLSDIFPSPCKLHIFNSYINPNATCPVCGEPVFFYQNQYGSAVYFDELGPPWPKHPCTTSEYSAVNTYIPSEDIDSPAASKTYKWQVQGLTPLLNWAITKISSVLYSVQMKDHDLCYFFKSYKNNIHKNPPDIIFHTADLSAEIMIEFYWLSGSSLAITGYKSKDKALINHPSLKPTPPKPTPQPNTSLGLALHNALYQTEKHL